MVRGSSMVMMVGEKPFDPPLGGEDGMELDSMTGWATGHVTESAGRDGTVRSWPYRPYRIIRESPTVYVVRPMDSFEAECEHAVLASEISHVLANMMPESLLNAVQVLSSSPWI